MTVASASRRAHALVAQALKDGSLVRPSSCELCGCPDRPEPGHTWRELPPPGRPWSILDAHHEDYDKPLDVIWLCGSCHRGAHGPGLPAYVERLRRQLAGAEQLLQSGRIGGKQ